MRHGRAFRQGTLGTALLLLLLLRPVPAAEAQVSVPSGQFPTIQSAINAIGVSLAQGTVINVGAGTFAGGLTVPGGKAFTVAGAGAGRTVVSGGSPVLFINGSGAGVRFQGLTLSNGSTAGFGGGFLVNSSSNVSFANCAIVGNAGAIAGGGGALDNGSSVTIDNCTIQGNTATGPDPVGDGGGLFVVGGSRLVLTGTTIAGNTAASSGAGIRANLGATVIVNGGAITGNTAGFFGGGAFVSGGSTATFTGVTVTGNTSGTGARVNGVGGGLAFADATATVQSSVVTGNTARFAGGGIYTIATFGQVLRALDVIDSDVGNNVTLKHPAAGPIDQPVGGGIYVEDNVQATITRTRVHDNVAAAGGGFASFQGRITIDSSIVEDNRAQGTQPFQTVDGQGGALQATAGPISVPTIVVRDSVVRRNVGIIGGGLVVAGNNAPVTIQRALFDRNQASIEGGAVFGQNIVLAVTDSLFLRNGAAGAGPNGGVVANQGGGALFLLGSITTIAGSTFADNTAASRGGAIFVAGGGLLQVDASRLYNNAAGPSGGGGLFVGGNPALSSASYVQNSVIAHNAGFQIAEDTCVVGYANDTVTPRPNQSDFYTSLNAPPPCRGDARSLSTFQAFFGGSHDASPPTFVAFGAFPPAKPAAFGQSAGRSVLAWSAAQAAAINVNPGVSGETSPIGTADVQPACTTTYALAASNPSRAAAATVSVLGAGPVPIADFFPYDPGFRGGVYVAAGDVTGDGRAEVITGVGAGGGPDVRIFDATALTAGPMTVFFPYDPGFLGGVYVAAGDVTGDGRADIVTGVGTGGGPDVRVFDGAAPTAGPLAVFFPYDPGFRGGVYVAAGNVTGNSRADLVTGVGLGGGPDVRVFDGGTLSPAPVTVIFPFPPTVTSGIRVAAGDVNGDGIADIVVGAGPGGGPHVRVLSGANPAVVLTEFFAFESTFTGGVQLAAGDVDGDGRADIVVGRGPGGQPQIRVISGATGAVLADFFAYDPAFTGGVQVAAGRVTGGSRAQIVTGVGVGGGPHVRVFSLPACP
jgi:hypothetical protein